LREGLVVVMTDYEGLGTTDRRHPYLLGVSEAAGVLDIVRAARQGLSELTGYLLVARLRGSSRPGR
jgi:hypothetical protein